MNTVFKNVGDFTKTLGSWWSGEYDGRDEIHAFVDALIHVARSQHDLLEEIVRAVDVYAVAPFRFSQFAKVRLYRQTDKQATIKYDTGLKYDVGWRYDQAILDGNVFTVDTNIANIAMFLDRPGRTEWSLTQPFDFELQNNEIVFSPQALQQLLTVYAVENRDGTAEYIDVWARGVERDYQDVFAAFGAVHRLYGKSSPQYARVVQAIHRCLVAGSTQGSVLEFVAACIDEPLTKQVSERVEHVYTTGASTTVVTSKHVYKHDSAHTTLVSPGQILPRYSRLSDRITLYAALSDLPLPCIAVPATWLPACVGGTVYLPNENVALQITSAAGFTKVSWPSPGSDAINKRFFDIAHTVGIAASTDVPVATDTSMPPSNVIVALETAGERWYRKATLAHLLDSRTLSVGEPTTQHLPGTINPAQLVANTIMQNTVWGVYIRGSFATRNTQYAAIAKLSQILPPQTGLYLVLEPFEIRENIATSSVSNTTSVVDLAATLSNTVPTVMVAHEVQFVDII